MSKAHSKSGPAASGGSAKPSAHKAELDQLRVQIDSIDRKLVDLLAQRLQVVQQVTKVKQKHDLPTFHPAREENLISARRAQAADAGLEPDFVEDLFRTVLRHSRVGQLDTLGRRGVRPGAKVLIVGGRGQMGRFLSRWFQPIGLRRPRPGPRGLAASPLADARH